MSEAVMMALIKKGLGRQRAYELLRKLALKALDEKRHLKEVLAEDEGVRRHLSQKEIEDMMNPRKYIGTAVKQVERVLEIAKKERKTCRHFKL
jgi:adenylosuccinate lyase